MSVLSTGLSGLQAFQRALSTTGHNIANAATEGYSRQRVELVPKDPLRLGGSYLGTGVNVQTIRRLQDDLIDNQVRTRLSDHSSASIRAAYAERIDNLLADESTGLAPTLENFFSALQDVASDPTAPAARLVLLDQTESLAGRFESINTRLDEQRQLVNGQLENSLEELNQYAKSVAELNEQIAARTTDGHPINDLLDQRDTVLRKMAEKVDIARVTQDNNTIHVFIGNGQPLVVGSGATELSFSNLSGDPANPSIGLKLPRNEEPVNITRFVTGGEIGGLLETRTELLDKAQNQLGLMALNMASRFNEQNGLGLDQDGEIGGDLFELPDIGVYPSMRNSADTVPTVTFEDTSDLTASDYQLYYTGSNFQLTRLSDESTVTLTADATDPNILIGEGLRIDTNALSGAVQRDTWLIQPTRNAATQLEVAVTDPAKFATASGALADSLNTGEARLTDLRMSTDAGNPVTTASYLPAAIVFDAGSDEFNVLSTSYGAAAGSATVESFRVLDKNDADLFTPIAVDFDATHNQFVVGQERFALDSTGTTTIQANGWELKLQGTPTAGTVLDINVNTIAATAPQPAVTTLIGPGWELDIKGTPDDGDLFTVELSKDRPGDNRNILEMADVQGERLLQGRATLQGGYDTLLADVGTQTRGAQISRDSTGVALAAAQEERESLSGVNLDEEAANMLRFRQAYQAAAQIIATSNTMFEALLGAVR